jgi:rhodanese-related sulfurtransferase
MDRQGKSFKLTFKSWVKEMTIILASIIGLALVVNALRPHGIALLAPKSAFNNGISPSSLVQGISVDDAFEEFRNGVALLVDARSHEEYLEGHIAGAVSLPEHAFDEVFEEVVDRLEGYEMLITYCDGESCALSPALAEKLHQLGFQNVFYMLDGWSLWLERGHPVTFGARESG